MLTQLCCTGVIRGRRDLLNQATTLSELSGEVIAGFIAKQQITQPCAKVIDPATDGIFPRPQSARRKVCRPAVVPITSHRDGRPFITASRPHMEMAGKFIMAVTKDVSRDRYRLIDEPFGGKAAAINVGDDTVNGDAAKGSRQMS
jgi:hypothetical protein